ncbi:MAG TPA: hypothetical protein VNH11_06955 [Pirellulales bacterium]|nr:hypothetical protein [Pirellulales bacterium]
MFAFRTALLLSAILLMAADHAAAQQAAARKRWISEYDAQVLAGAPITRPAVIRNYQPIDLGGSGTRVGNSDEPAVDLYSRRNSLARPQTGAGNGNEPAVDTALYPYYNPSFIGYGNYGSYAGYGYGGHPYGVGAAYGPTNYPPWLYRPRYFYPYRYYPLRTGWSVYNPYFYYNNSYYGGYSSPFWTGFGGFAFPYHFGAFGSGGAGYTFGGFGQPYRYGIFGYPYPGLFNQTWAYQPSPAYFMYPGMGGLYSPPGFYGFPGYYGYAGYGMGLATPAGGFYW